MSNISENIIWVIFLKDKLTLWIFIFTFIIFVIIHEKIRLYHLFAIVLFSWKWIISATGLHVFKQCFKSSFNLFHIKKIIYKFFYFELIVSLCSEKNKRLSYYTLTFHYNVNKNWKYFFLITQIRKKTKHEISVTYGTYFCNINLKKKLSIKTYNSTTNCKSSNFREI